MNKHAGLKWHIEKILRRNKLVTATHLMGRTAQYGETCYTQ